MNTLILAAALLFASPKESPMKLTPARRAPRRRRITFVTLPRSMPSPIAITELPDYRIGHLRDIMREVHKMKAGERFDVEVHRNRCDIVVHNDDMLECTCLPLALWFGAQA